MQIRRTEALGEASLRVTSDPSGASVRVGGRTVGHTPDELRVAAGGHEIVLHHDGYADAVRMVTLGLGAGGQADLHADLWLWTPQAQQLRPTFPGATIAGAAFLADGRIALTLALSPDDERQTWLLDDDGGMRRLGPPEARGPQTVAPDGGRIAYAARGQDDDPNTGGAKLAIRPRVAGGVAFPGLTWARLPPFLTGATRSR